jgi:hypothetical protein
MFENFQYLGYFKNIFKEVLYKKMLRNTGLQDKRALKPFQ